MNIYSVLSIIVLKVIVISLSDDSGVCYPELGCFNITKDYKHLIYRPINLLPESPERIQTKIYFYSRYQPNGSLISYKTSELNNFIPTIETKIIIHGFLDNPYIGKWINRLKDELLNYGKHNIFIIDWSEGNGN